MWGTSKIFCRPLSFPAPLWYLFSSLPVPVSPSSSHFLHLIPFSHLLTPSSLFSVFPRLGQVRSVWPWARRPAGAGRRGSWVLRRHPWPAGGGRWPSCDAALVSWWDRESIFTVHVCGVVLVREMRIDFWNVNCEVLCRESCEFCACKYWVLNFVMWMRWDEYCVVRWDDESYVCLRWDERWNRKEKKREEQKRKEKKRNNIKEKEEENRDTRSWREKITFIPGRNTP
jgi:hypothetical protein